MTTLPEYQDGIILKIYVDERSDNLAVLKCSLVGTLYWLIFSPYSFALKKITQTKFFVNANYHFINSLQGRPHDLKKFKAGNGVDDPIIKKVYQFDIDSEAGVVLMEVLENDGIFLLLFNIDGELLRREKLHGKNVSHLSPEDDYVCFFNDDTLVYLGEDYSSDSSLKIWRLSQSTKTEIDLLKDEALVGEEHWYESVRGFSVNPDKGLMGMIFEGTTYGIDSLKILSLSADNKLKPIFELRVETSSSALHDVQFDPFSNDFAVYELSYNQVAVRIYKLYDTTPPIIFNVDIDRSENFIRGLSFFAKHLFCVRTMDKIFIYQKLTGEKFTVLDRDYDSALFIGLEKIYYIKNSKLYIFDADLGNLITYPVEEKIKIPPVKAPVNSPQPPITNSTNTVKIDLWNFLKMVIFILLLLWILSFLLKIIG